MTMIKDIEESKCRLKTILNDDREFERLIKIFDYRHHHFGFCEEAVIYDTLSKIASTGIKTYDIKDFTTLKGLSIAIDLGFTNIKEEMALNEKDYIGRPWIGVDLDGTLAHYDGWKGIDHIGEPIPRMLDRVLRWLETGKDVRIFTARIGPGNNADLASYYIENWCLKHLGVVLPITNIKDAGMIELWDDRCVQVIPNEGASIEEHYHSIGRGKKAKK